MNLKVSFNRRLWMSLGLALVALAVGVALGVQTAGATSARQVGATDVASPPLDEGMADAAADNGGMADAAADNEGMADAAGHDGAAVTPTAPRVDPCLFRTNFDDNPPKVGGPLGTYSGWGQSNISSFTLQPGGPSGSGYYLESKDGMGASTVNAPASWLGNWKLTLDNLKPGCLEFCYDINLLDDGEPGSTAFSANFAIYNGATYAQFVSTQKVSEPGGPFPGWHHVCAPIRATKAGQPVNQTPSDGSGTWVLNPPTASWNALLGNITAVRFPVDWASSNQGERVGYDNFSFCKKDCPADADFTVKTICVGNTSVFTSTSVNAATYLWNFGGATTSVVPNNTAANPMVTYAGPGTYTVELCINGALAGSGPPLCVKKTVTVLPKPNKPVIDGPIMACGTGKYCVKSPQAGVTYVWGVSGGTVQGPNGGPCATINWTNGGGGVVTVVALTNTDPQCAERAEFTVLPCGVWTDRCCKNTVIQIGNESLNMSGTNQSVGVFNATISVTPPTVNRVTVDLINTWQTFTPMHGGTCPAPSGPANSYILDGTLPGANPGVLPVPYSRALIWNPSGPNMTLTNALGQLNIQFPNPSAVPDPSQPHCGQILHFCIRYTFLGPNCTTCEVIKCYAFPWQWVP